MKNISLFVYLVQRSSTTWRLASFVSGVRAQGRWQAGRVPRHAVQVAFSGRTKHNSEHTFAICVWSCGCVTSVAPLIRIEKTGVSSDNGVCSNAYAVLRTHAAPSSTAPEAARCVNVHLFSVFLSLLFQSLSRVSLANTDSLYIVRS